MIIEKFKYDKKTYNRIYEDVERVIKKLYKDELKKFGICHSVFATRKALYRDAYNIEYYSPSEQHPGIICD